MKRKGVTWVSIDLDWLTGPLVRPRSYCRACSWHQRCAKRLTGPGAGQGRPILADTSYGNNLRARLQQLKRLLLSLTCRCAIMRECHASIMPFLHDGDTVWHVDAHPDDEPWTTPLFCGNWTTVADRRNIDVRWVEPEEVTINGPANVFICLSRPFTPRRLDREVFSLLICLNCPTQIDLRR